MEYTPISIDEMRSVLEANGFSELIVAGGSTKEFVYEKVLNPGNLPKIVIKVYTSISKEQDVSRRRGQDAIRVCSVNITDKVGWIKTIKVLRVNGWRTNLQKAIGNVSRQSTQRLSRIRQYQKPTRSDDMQSLIDHIWGKGSKEGFSAEASTLDANKETRPRNLCPNCDGIYAKKDLIKTIPMGDPIDHEIGGWEFKCPHCGTILTVFND